MFFFSLTWFNLDAKIQPFLIKKTFLHFFLKNFILCFQKPAGILQGYDIVWAETRRHIAGVRHSVCGNPQAYCRGTT